MQRHTLIGFDTETAFIQRLQDRVPVFTRARMASCADSDLASLAAIRAGAASASARFLWRHA